MNITLPTCPPISLQAHAEEDKTFVLLDDDDDDDEEEKDDFLEDDAESDVHDVTGCADVAISLLVSVCNFVQLLSRSFCGCRLDLLCRFSVENAYIDEKEDACDALGEIARNVG